MKRSRGTMGYSYVRPSIKYCRGPRCLSIMHSYSSHDEMAAMKQIVAAKSESEQQNTQRKTK